MTMLKHWQLNPEISFLNHGSFGAVPVGVTARQREVQDALEKDPIRFLAPERDLEPKLDFVRRKVAELVRADANDIAFVRTATDGVNAVLRSFPFVAGDEVLITDHGYNACNNAVRFAAERAGATVRVANIPFPITSGDEVVQAVASAITDRTRLLLIDHVTSPTGLVFPLKKIIDAAQLRDVRVMVDGAHAPGMVPLDLKELDADYYTANHHKWLCGPKVSGFLYVRSQLQHEVRPTVISHGASKIRPGRSRFLTEFDWCGTFDPTPLMCVPLAISFLSQLFGSFSVLLKRNRKLALQSRDVLCDALGIPVPAPDEMIGSLVSVPLQTRQDAGHPPEELDPLQVRLYDKHKIEVPVFVGPNRTRILRVSIQAYNDIGQIERLADILKSELGD